MGANISLVVEKFGFYPDIKGKVTVTVNALQQPLQAIQLTDRGADMATKLVIRVKCAEPASETYYNETFKPRLEELLAEE